ncbi:VanZ family protein [Paenibacillus sp. Marseille-Q7038]
MLKTYNKKLMLTTVVWFLLFLYTYFIFKVILFKFCSVDLGNLLIQLSKILAHPDLIVDRWDTANLDLFRTIIRQATQPNLRNVANLIGNFAIFVPFGLLVAMTVRKWSSFFLVLLLSFGLSLCLESLQLVLSMGTFDIDDLLLNTAGGIAGYIIFGLGYILLEIWQSQFSVSP